MMSRLWKGYCKEIAGMAIALEIRRNFGTAVVQQFEALLAQRNLGLAKQASLETHQNVTVTQHTELDLSRQLA